MQIILRKEFESLGKTGEVVTVKAGYARNYLIPRGIALMANKSNMARLAEEQKMSGRRDVKEKRLAGDLSKRLEGLKVIAGVQTGEEDRMFGSVTASDIADLIKARGIEVDRRKIHLEEPIRHLGEYEIPIKLHRDVTVNITLDVVKTD